MTEEEFIETFLYPAFNDLDEVAEVDLVFGNAAGGTQVLSVVTISGDEFQLAVTKVRSIARAALTQETPND